MLSTFAVVAAAWSDEVRYVAGCARVEYSSSVTDPLPVVAFDGSAKRR